MDLTDMITITEYARLVNRDPANIRQKCLRGTIPEAVKIGREWFVPRNTKLCDYRMKSNRDKK